MLVALFTVALRIFLPSLQDHCNPELSLITWSEEPCFDQQGSNDFTAAQQLV